MRRASAIVAGLAGVGLGVLVSLFGFNTSQSLRASTSDRYQDYVMCTGAVSINPRLQTDGVWLLDYRSGKLLATVVDKSQGKIVGWTEVNLADEFKLQPLQDVHFIMTTGYIAQGMSALYVAETSTGKFGVYSMGPAANGSGISINRHDLTSFRNVQPAVQPAAATIPGMPGMAAQPVPGTPMNVLPGSPFAPGGGAVTPIPPPVNSGPPAVTYPGMTTPPTSIPQPQYGGTPPPLPQGYPNR